MVATQNVDGHFVRNFLLQKSFSEKVKMSFMCCFVAQLDHDMRQICAHMITHNNHLHPLSLSFSLPLPLSLFPSLSLSLFPSLSCRSSPPPHSYIWSHIIEQFANAFETNHSLSLSLFLSPTVLPVAKMANTLMASFMDSKKMGVRQNGHQMAFF